MENGTLKKILPGIVFILFLIPVITSSLLDLQQKRANELFMQKVLAEMKAQYDANEKLYLMGKFDPAQRDDFTQVPMQYSLGGLKMYLRKETLAAFLQMAIAAKRDDVELNLASATRNFDYQKNLWEKKWNGTTLVNGQDLSKTIPDGLQRFKKILEYSAVPGISRHHWGTDIDINNADLPYFETDEGIKVYNWLTANAATFGFCQPYTLKGSGRPTGYNEEKWHWSYLPLAKNFTKEYKTLITDADITGFLGDKYVSQLDLINTNVLGINPGCL